MTPGLIGLLGALGLLGSLGNRLQAKTVPVRVKNKKKKGN